MLKGFCAFLLSAVCVLGAVNFCIAQESTEDALQSAESYGISSQVFDRQLGMYKQSMGTGLEFLSSVPNGAVVRDGVYFDIPSNISVSLECDGTAVPFANCTPITKQGYYIMRLSANDFYTNEVINSAFMFRISLPPDNRVKVQGYAYPRVSCRAEITSDGDLYRYMLPNYKSFFTIVPFYGAEVESAVFVLPQNVGYSLKHNGQVIALVDNKAYTQSGEYSLTVIANSYGKSDGYEAVYETVLSFTIPGEEVYEESVEDYEDTYYPEEDLPEISQVTEEEVSTEAEPVQDILLESFFDSVGLYSESFSNGDA